MQLSTSQATDIDLQQALALSRKRGGQCHVDSRCRRLNTDRYMVQWFPNFLPRVLSTHIRILVPLSKIVRLKRCIQNNKGVKLQNIILFVIKCIQSLLCIIWGLASAEHQHFGQAKQWLELFKLKICQRTDIPSVGICQSVVLIISTILTFPLGESQLGEKSAVYDFLVAGLTDKSYRWI